MSWFLVLKFEGFVKRVKRSKPFTIYVSPQCLQTTFASKPGSFFPLANLSLCNNKHFSDQTPEWTQPKLYPQGER